MPEAIQCPHCQRKLLLPEAYLDQTVQCPSCEKLFPAMACLPAVRAATPPPAAAPQAEDSAEALPEPPRLRQRLRPRSAAAPGAALTRQSGWSRGVVAAVVMLIGLIGGLVLLVFLVTTQSHLPKQPWMGKHKVVVPEDDRQRRQEVIEAFQKQRPLNEQEITEELKPLFTGLGGAFRAADQNLLLSHFNAERMLDEMAALEMFPPRALRERDTMVRGLRSGLGNALVQQGPLFRWTDFEIRKVKKLAGNEAVVIVRHHMGEGTFLKFRWWVTKQRGTWQVFDFEDLDMGLRFSTTAASLIGDGVANNPEFARGMNHLREALLAIVVQHDPAAADRALKQVEGTKFPVKVEALRSVVTGLVRLHHNQDQAALDAFEQAHGFHPDMPCLDLFKGIALNNLGRWEPALKHLETYRDLLGDDATVCYELGEALRGVQRFPAAAVSYRKALDYDPKHANAFLGLLRTLAPGDRKDDLGTRFARLDNRRQQFDICAEDCRTANDGESLELLVLAMRKVEPAYAPPDYYLALVRVWGGQTDQAVQSFRTALTRETDAAKRRDWTTAFLQAMVHAGKVTEAYAVVPEPREAFRILATQLKKDYRTEFLKQLVTAHAKKAPDDPLLPLYHAEVYIYDGKYELAEKTFRAALAKPVDAATLELFRSSRVLARYYTGQALSAYAEIGPKQETFLQLAGLCLQDRKEAQLEALLDARARTDPDNRDVLVYRCRLRVRQGRVEEGTTLFKAALARPATEQQKRMLEADFLREMVDIGKALEGYQAVPDGSQALQILADDLLDQAKSKELRQLLDAHRLRHPNDVQLSFYTGELLMDEQVWDKAAQAFAEGLKKADPKQRVRYRPRYIHAMYKAGRGLQAYQESDARKETFRDLSRQMIYDRKGAELEALVAAHRPHAGDDPELLYGQALAAIFVGRPGAAAPLLRQAHGKQTDTFRKQDYLRTFVLEMEKAGRGLDGYRAAPDAVFAFQTLAQTLAFQKKAGELEKLLQEHNKSHAGEPWPRVYTGELHLLRGAPALAEQEFAAALARLPAKDQWAPRQGLFRARIKTGKVADTYREAAAGTATFVDLANLCVQDKNAGQLQALVEAHRQAKPDDPDLVAWDLEVKWLSKDYEAVVKLFTAQRQAALDLRRFQWKIDRYVVRSLIKLKRYDDAVREAETLVKDRHGDQVLLVLAHASRGDVKQAIAVMEHARAHAWLIGTCYRDADLGPLLRGESFQAFRERFPEPKDGRGGRDLDDRDLDDS